MFNLQKLVRPNILKLSPYSSARDEYSQSEGIFLDANENPFGELNRYPDPYQNELKSKISKLKNVASENIFLGNGSDEVIDLIYRVFCEPKTDKILTFKPTYGMYKVAAEINDVELFEIDLDKNFQIDFKEYKKAIKKYNFKVVIACSPNNPSGNIFNEIDKILSIFDGIVVVDEAYIDFSETKSFLEKLEKYPNLIVTQTFSKAWAMAGARLGMAFASKEIVNLLNKVKPPYNISTLNQNAIIDKIYKIEEFENQKVKILEQKSILKNELQKFDFVEKIFPSNANFLLVKVKDADFIYNTLIDKKIIIRNRHFVAENCVRITVGTPEENKKLLNALNEIY